MSWLRFVLSRRRAPTLMKCRSRVKSLCKNFITGMGHNQKKRTARLVIQGWNPKRANFSPELMRQLKEDAAAQAKVTGEIVGLDFDPILFSQNPGQRYIAGNVTPKGDRYWVDVYGVWDGKKSAKPSVVPELIYRNGKWVFVNFHYGHSKFPENENLLSVLKVLRENRKKYPN